MASKRTEPMNQRASHIQIGSNPNTEYVSTTQESMKSMLSERSRLPKDDAGQKSHLVAAGVRNKERAKSSWVFGQGSDGEPMQTTYGSMFPKGAGSITAAAAPQRQRNPQGDVADSGEYRMQYRRRKPKLLDTLSLSMAGPNGTAQRSDLRTAKLLSSGARDAGVDKLTADMQQLQGALDASAAAAPTGRSQLSDDSGKTQLAMRRRARERRDWAELGFPQSLADSGLYRLHKQPHGQVVTNGDGDIGYKGVVTNGDRVIRSKDVVTNGDGDMRSNDVTNGDGAIRSDAVTIKPEGAVSSTDAVDGALRTGGSQRILQCMLCRNGLRQRSRSAGRRQFEFCRTQMHTSAGLPAALPRIRTFHDL